MKDIHIILGPEGVRLVEYLLDQLSAAGRENQILQTENDLLHGTIASLEHKIEELEEELDDRFNTDS